MFNKIVIIGMGLIGSSIAQNVKQKGLAEILVASDKSLDVCERVVQLGLADEVTDNAAETVKDADLVILAVPVGAMEAAARHIAPFLQSGTILSDTGSVKSSVIKSVKPLCRSGIEFVPAHPIAGTENSGPDSGFAELFRGRWCILTPLPGTSIRAVEKLTQFWEACGSSIAIMEPEHHDLVLGITSHLPHLIAYTIVGTAAAMEDDIKSEVIKYSAGGFRDFTRIAASNPIMWRDIFLNNKEAVLDVLSRFNKDLADLETAIREGNGEKLQAFFTKTRQIRKDIIKEGQAS